MILNFIIKKDLTWLELNNLKIDIHNFLIKNIQDLEVKSNLIHNQNYDLILKTLTPEEKKEKKKIKEIPKEKSASFNIQFNVSTKFEINSENLLSELKNLNIDVEEINCTYIQEDV